MSFDTLKTAATICAAVLVAVVGVIPIQGCSVAGYDNRDRIAQTVLYGNKGSLDEKAFGGALLEKFASANSPTTALTKFVESFGGQCSIDSKNKDFMHCSIPEAATICVENRIDLTVATSNGAISSIYAKSRSTGC